MELVLALECALALLAALDLAAWLVANAGWQGPGPIGRVGPTLLIAAFKIVRKLPSRCASAAARRAAMQRAQCRGPAMPLCLSEMCSVAPLGVQTESPVPRPWSKEARERVYFYHSNGIVMHYTESRWAHQKEQEAIAGEARVNETFRRLVRDGMTFNELGLDLTLLQHVRHRGDPKAVLQDEDVKMAVAMLVVAKTARSVHLPNFAQALWELDQPARRPACALAAAELATSGGARLASFLAHGVVQVRFS